jgi:hypothetical protein
METKDSLPHLEESSTGRYILSQNSPVHTPIYSHLCPSLPSGLFLIVPPPIKTLHALCFCPHVCYMLCRFRLSCFILIVIGKEYKL